MPNGNQSMLPKFFDEVNATILDLRTPIYMCVAARVTDLDGILTSMSKIKWDINHVNVEHSTYINNINRVSCGCDSVDYNNLKITLLIMTNHHFYRVCKCLRCDWKRLKKRCRYPKSRYGIVLPMSFHIRWLKGERIFQFIISINIFLKISPFLLSPN